jgi:hypothetical protein
MGKDGAEGVSFLSLKKLIPLMELLWMLRLQGCHGHGEESWS